MINNSIKLFDQNKITNSFNKLETDTGAKLAPQFHILRNSFKNLILL